METQVDILVGEQDFMDCITLTPLTSDGREVLWYQHLANAVYLDEHGQVVKIEHGEFNGWHSVRVSRRDFDDEIYEELATWTYADGEPWPIVLGVQRGDDIGILKRVDK